METTQQHIGLSKEVTNTINLVKEALKKSPTGVSFISIKNYTNKDGETSNYLFNIGASYANAVKSDIETLTNLDITQHEFKQDKTIIEQARLELIESLTRPNENISNGQKEAYTTLTRGVKIHNETGYLYLYGYRVNKTVITQGTYKEVKSRPLTLAKKELKKLLKTDKFRQFALQVGNSITTKNDTLEF